MKIKVFKDDKILSARAADRVCAQLRDKPDSLLCIAAGHSSLGVFQELSRRAQVGEADFSRAGFVAMDEWLGMNETDSGSCGDFLRQNFLSQVNIPARRVRLVDGRTQDIARECQALGEFITAEGGIDFLILGMGMNGHLALNEPGTDFSLSVHATALDSVTQRIGQKYFDPARSAPQLTGGLTIGIADMAARQVLLLVNGAKKAPILKEVLESPVTTRLPATALKEMPQAALWCDLDAASLCPGLELAQ
jgi:glucosamine-6-phosphate isomerase